MSEEINPVASFETAKAYRGVATAINHEEGEVIIVCANHRKLAAVFQALVGVEPNTSRFKNVIVASAEGLE